MAEPWRSGRPKSALGATNAHTMPQGTSTDVRRGLRTCNANQVSLTRRSHSNGPTVTTLNSKHDQVVFCPRSATMTPARGGGEELSPDPLCDGGVPTAIELSARQTSGLRPRADETSVAAARRGSGAHPYGRGASAGGGGVGVRLRKWRGVLQRAADEGGEGAPHPVNAH